jgi:hypothetical protein
MRAAPAERVPLPKYPIRGIFFGCCASPRETVVRKIAAISQREILGFIVFA